MWFERAVWGRHRSVSRSQRELLKRQIGMLSCARVSDLKWDQHRRTRRAERKKQLRKTRMVSLAPLLSHVLQLSSRGRPGYKPRMWIGETASPASENGLYGKIKRDLCTYVNKHGGAPTAFHRIVGLRLLRSQVPHLHLFISPSLPSFGFPFLHRHDGHRHDDGTGCRDFLCTTVQVCHVLWTGASGHGDHCRECDGDCQR